MSMWRGYDGTVGESGMPHVTKMAHKPCGVGVELKNAACGQTGILVSLELAKYKEVKAAKKFRDKYPAGIAVILKMLSPFKGHPHHVFNDSYFPSITSAAVLKAEYGM